jgi:nucleoside-diphosphate-sugar epimerase
VSDKSNKTVSVYGSTGFVGSHFSEKSAFQIRRIPRNERSPESNEILYFIGTIHNYNIFDTNLKVLIETLEAVRKFDTNAVFNFVSTWFVYGQIRIPFAEDRACNPKGFYSITKYAAELLLRSYCETYSMKYRIIRLGNIIGSGDNKTSAKKNAIQFLADKIIAGEDVELYEGGRVIRDLLHVDDAVEGLDLIIARGKLNEIYNLASGQGTVLADLLMSLKEITRSSSTLKSIETPAFHKMVQARDAVLDISKIKALGFNISRPLSASDLL